MLLGGVIGLLHRTGFLTVVKVELEKLCPPNISCHI